MIKEKLVKLYQNWSEEEVKEIIPLPRSGSNRSYFRIISENKNAIGVHNSDRKENLAFIEFSKSFKKAGLKVPEIYAEQIIDDIYLQQDLGKDTLFQYISSEREKSGFSDEIDNLYKKVLTDLPKFQIIGGKEIDYSICYPRSDFDEQSMKWDLSYFKYYFLKLAGISFDEQLLENDFDKLVDYLLTADRHYFMYRDFQSRNIMVKNNEVYFIDYQGGRRGALQYDLASLLFDAKADIPNDKRNEYLDFYINQLKSYIEIDENKFKSYYYLFILIRIMQAMGAYGFRGFYEKKSHFLASIPYAQDNLKFILDNCKLPIELKTLKPILYEIAESEKLKEIANTKKLLKVNINSFSYKRGIPVDETGNGGGFVFDCRALPNPGRIEKYKNLTGRNLEVINFLKNKNEVHEFLKSSMELVNSSIQNYLSRDFDNLMINFGCTGGQHRSVFCAEQLAKRINEKYNVEIVVRHREQELKR